MPKVNDKCIHCAGCVGICPANAITLNEFIIEINEKCIECGQCIKFCPVGAMEK